MSNLILQSPSALSVDLPQLEQMAGYIVSSNFFGIKRKEDAITLMLLCLADGLNPIEAVRRYHIINGRPTMKSEAMLAEFQKAGGSVEWVDYSAECVTGKFIAADGSTITLTWDKAKAQRADLWGKTDTWRKYPDAMLRNRCISEAVRSVAPGVTNGIYTEDEALHMPSPEPVYGSARSPRSQPRAITPEDVLPSAGTQHTMPPALPAAPTNPRPPAPMDKFIARAKDLRLTPPAITADGKISKKGTLVLLSEVRGEEVTELPAPNDHAAWEKHLAALLAVYPEAPLEVESDLSDPFADEEERAGS